LFHTLALNGYLKSLNKTNTFLGKFVYHILFMAYMFRPQKWSSSGWPTKLRRVQTNLENT